jgi:hypothetical protein
MSVGRARVGQRQAACAATTASRTVGVGHKAKNRRLPMLSASALSPMCGQPAAIARTAA